MATREQRWEALYERLLAALAALGDNQPSDPNGDYWLVDDDWGGHHHKLCVTRAAFWSSAVENAIREVLAGSFRDWGVYVVFEDGTGRAGFIAYWDGVGQAPRWP